MQKRHNSSSSTTELRLFALTQENNIWQTEELYGAIFVTES